jgi:hypothetical protein
MIRRELIEGWSLVFDEEIVTVGNRYPILSVEPEVADGLMRKVYEGMGEVLNGTNLGISKLDLYDSPSDPGPKSPLIGIGTIIGGFTLHKIFNEKGITRLKYYARGNIYTLNKSPSIVKLKLFAEINAIIAEDWQEVDAVDKQLSDLEFLCE